jgi:hypothetical protein
MAGITAAKSAKPISAEETARRREVPLIRSWRHKIVSDNCGRRLRQTVKLFL